MNIKAADINDLKFFTKYGDHFTFPESKENRYLYERRTPGSKRVSYEIVKPVRHKNPDGSMVNIYPSSEKGGTYGFTTYDLSKANWYLSNEDWSLENRMKAFSKGSK